MSKVFGAGMHKGFTDGIKTGKQMGVALNTVDVGMKVLCLATAIRQAQKDETPAQYVLLNILIEMMESQLDGPLVTDDKQNDQQHF
jgi:hypothetical protein